MTHTIVASATQEHIIGFDKPFTVIGERINPTGRKKLAAEMQAGNFETVIKDALAQMEAGAHILDVNAGVTAVNPRPWISRQMRQTIEIENETTDAPEDPVTEEISTSEVDARDRVMPKDAASQI